MLDLHSVKKQKVSLSDYDYKGDVEKRVLMSELSETDLLVLQELLYSPLKISIEQFFAAFEEPEELLMDSCKKLSKLQLFQLDLKNQIITIDKEERRYFETHIVKFDENYVPDMDYIAAMLRIPPIHVLPTWYAIPRTSDNIFDSLVEKYLLTPQTFQRYLSDLQFPEAHYKKILDVVMQSPEFSVSLTLIQQKLKLTHEQCIEALVYLEYHLVCTLSYRKSGKKWKEEVTLFKEWRDYLLFIKRTTPTPIQKTEEIVRTRPQDFSFVQDLALLLHTAKKPAPAIVLANGKQSLAPAFLKQFLAASEELTADEEYIHRLVQKALLFKFAEVEKGIFKVLPAATDWIEMRLEQRALHLFRSPLNRSVLKEAEKSITRVLHLGWVYLEEFLAGVMVPIKEDSTIVLKRTGKAWAYRLPQYIDEEKALIKKTLFESLFEAGIIATGTHKGKECFVVTAFGRSLFGE